MNNQRDEYWSGLGIPALSPEEESIRHVIRSTEHRYETVDLLAMDDPDGWPARHDIRNTASGLESDGDADAAC